MEIRKVVSIILFLTIPIQINSQEIKIPLKLNTNYNPMWWSGIDFSNEGEEDESSVVAEEGKTKIGKLEGDILIKATRLDNSDNSYLLTIDTDGDKDLNDEKNFEILPDSALFVNIKRIYENANEIYLPYRFTYERYHNWWHIFQSDFLNEKIRVQPRYRVEGRLSVDSCETLVALVDHHADGKFDILDSYAGSNLCIDRNNDGKIWGSDEWLFTAEIIEYCDQQFLVDSIASDGSFITLVNTELKIPKIGEQTPYFSYKTTKGELITPEKLKGEVYLLDFWASWCQPCISKFPKLQELDKDKFRDRIKIFTVNVDRFERIERAKKVLEDYKIKWPSFVEGKGQKDTYWKMLSSVNGLRPFGIPLYVIIDKQGQIQYSGYGGEDLVELEKKVLELL
ncbi:MAG: TlpA family protein disulfide reductase [Ignavibacteriales bacterium]|nr:TlpA family protein disulfide reductase [Ignavibacteriales bacterium]